MESPTLTDENDNSQLKTNMARRKAEVILQRDLETQEDWEDFLSKEGLLVIDIYQEWAGPCTSLVNNFKKLKNELSDELLRYAVAKADRIEALVQYRGKCKPCFLFFAGGVLVNVIRGAQYPLLKRSIINELEQEHKVLNGEARRVKVIDKEIPATEGIVEVEEEIEVDPPDFTVAIIKPDAVRDGKVDAIISSMKSDKIEILINEKKVLTEKTAREFYKHLSNEPFFEDYIKFMTSGPCHVLVLCKRNSEKGIISEWKEKLGPTSVEGARKTTPDSLRAKFGTEGYMNALHGSDDQPSAMRELGFFFPAMFSSLTKRISGHIERTLAIIRPDAYILYKDNIIQKIKEAGFHIALRKEIVLTREDIEEFYSDITEEDYFDDLVEEMTSGPLLALGLAREDAVSKWRDILGPTDKAEALEVAPDSLRAQFMVPETDVNLIHGSQTKEEAEKEINFFFPEEETVVVIKPDAFGTREEIMNKIQEAGFKITAKKEMVFTEQIINKMYKTDKHYFEEVKKYMMTGPSMLMVLTREDAIYGFRQLMGPVDPLEAKKIDPNLFRAQFGTNIICNAMHGSTTSGEAQELISAVFGSDTKWKSSDNATPVSLTSSEGPLTPEYAMAEEARANAEEQMKTPHSVVNIITESSTEDVPDMESSVEILGAKESPRISLGEEDDAIAMPLIERSPSKDREEIDITAEETTYKVSSENLGEVEDKMAAESPAELGQDNLAEITQAAQDESELPVEANESPEVASKSPEAVEEVRKSPEVVSTSPEVASKSPEAVEEVRKSPEVVSTSPEVASKSPEAVEEVRKSPEVVSTSPEVASKSPEAVEEVSKTPEVANESLVATEEASKLPEATEDVETTEEQ